MNSTLSIIKKNKLIGKGDIVGVACSGGRDSMALLHFLNAISTKLEFKVIAINIDHSIREKSEQDSLFVINYCQKNNIDILSYKVDVPSICKKEKIGLEQGARSARYNIFNLLLKEGKVNKIALGHHLQDQTETILLNIFRGTGLKGASGMKVKNNNFIRPMLTTSRTEIQAYIIANNIPFVDDESNFENDYSRNYIRNMIMPLVRNRWLNADSAITNFGNICAQDDAYINAQINKPSVIVNGNVARIPTNQLIINNSLSARLIIYAFNQISVNKNIESKHIKEICNLAVYGNNGAKLHLPNKALAIKEYNYITLTNRLLPAKQINIPFKKGPIDISSYGVIDTKLTRKLKNHNYTHIIDHKKLPADATWRLIKKGDIFEKFGGGTKPLNRYLIDKKVPYRLRGRTPVLASGNEVLIIAGVEISNKVKLDSNTTSAYGINVIRFI